MGDQRWTASLVEERLAEAADVLDRLPEQRIQGFFSTWPPIVRDYWEAYGRHAPELRRPWPSPAAIDRMDEAFEWLRWLDPVDARILWMRAEKNPWKAICWHAGMARATAHRHWIYGLSVIAWRLQGGRMPAKRSRQFLVEQARKRITL